MANKEKEKRESITSTPKKGEKNIIELKERREKRKIR